MSIFTSETTPAAFKELLAGIKPNAKQPFGKIRPWAWWVEITRGCNLRCGHCATRLFEPGKYEFMSMETWVQLIEIIREVAPYSRLEIGNAGEPTLNPLMPDFLLKAREMCPTLQLMTYSNGTTLLDGSVTYKTLFDAGLNMFYVNTYGPREKHIALAKESGYTFYEQCKKPKDVVNVFQYQKDLGTHVIMLADHPGNWPKRKVNRGAFSTFFNHLDWEAAVKFGLKPVTEAPARRCDQPSKYVNIYFDGAYTFCCFDFFREIAGTLGNVSEGLDGFWRFWLGKYMQDVRYRLHLKNRASHSMCSKCGFCSIRCDMPTWPSTLYEHYWTGNEWLKNKGPFLEVKQPEIPLAKIHNTFF